MTELAKAYDPAQVEEKWYAAWQAAQAFAGTVDADKEPHAIMIPPPNVTGMLHMGHILNNTLQDIFTRRARLEGKAAIWFPGTDHAGIATQTRVEKELRKAGQTRHDLGREKFLEKVWEWKEEHGGIILNQLKKLGASCDWDRTSFTLDEGYARAVLTSFVELYKRGYVYRGLRMSNWDPVNLTALSNEEVIPKPQKGLLYKVQYELITPTTDPDGTPRTHMEVATTRPETIPGDVAIAVNPEDPRYTHLLGQKVRRPIVDAEIPIIADAAVDIEFGTGALKITPAHDALDFDVGQRHNLEIIDTLNPDGTCNDHAGPELSGLDRFVARKKAAELLEASGNLVGTEQYENNVGFSERTDVPVEPRLTMQWWLRYPKAKEARRAVEAGLLKFHPQRWAKTYLSWLETMERDGIDWCISRQLWWGHRIPVWYKKGADRSAWTEADFQNPDLVHVSVDGPSDPENWEQESDVLDTWASSWLWPFANFGWPGDDAAKKAELDFFYPTSTLVTGFDIIFLWVARMVMAGLEFMGEEKATLTDAEIAARLPFKNVCMTGLIRDGQRRKMSKSLGNSPDPLDLIAEFGADAVRFGIVNIAPSGQDILFQFKPAADGKPMECPPVEFGRNFCNKLWNAARFRQMNGALATGAPLETLVAKLADTELDLWDRWILGRLAEATAQLEKAFASYELAAYPKVIYEFFWSDYCDWYVEAAKTRLRDDAQKGTVLAVMDLVLRQTLLLLEPLTPFIAEELWHGLGFAESTDALLQNTPLPPAAKVSGWTEKAAGNALQEVAALQAFIVKARGLKAQLNVANKRDVDLSFTAENDATKALLETHTPTLLNLIPAANLVALETAPDGMPAAVAEGATVYLDLASAIDVAAEKERLTKELAKLEKGLKAGQAKLANEKFVNSAPPNVVQGARDQLAATQAKHDELTRLLESLG